MVLHEQLWMLLSQKSASSISCENANHDSNCTCTSEFADIEQVYSVFRILLDPANLAKCEVGKILEDYIQKKESNEEDEQQLKPWSAIELVYNFRKLNENRLAYLKTGYLKPEKFEEYQKLQDKFTFKPQINETSAILEQKITSKFLNKHGQDLEKNYYSQNSKSIEQENSPPDQGVKSVNKSKQSINESQLENQSRMEGQDRYKLLFLKNQVREQELQQKLQEKQQKELDECTFAPSILEQSKKIIQKNNKNQTQDYVQRLFKRNPYQKKEELKKRAIQKKELEEMESCTFHPVINQTSEFENNNESKIELPKGFESTVGRMRHGYSNNQEKKQKLEHVPKGENYDRLLKKNIQPFDFSQDQKVKKLQPFIYIDVNVGGGKTGRIGLHENDNAYEVAKNFAMAFQLNAEMQKNLQTLIENQIEQYLEEKEIN